MAGTTLRLGLMWLGESWAGSSVVLAAELVCRWYSCGGPLHCLFPRGSAIIALHWHGFLSMHRVRVKREQYFGYEYFDEFNFIEFQAD